MSIIKVLDIKSNPAACRYINADAISSFGYSEELNATEIITRTHELFICEGNVANDLAKAITSASGTSVISIGYRHA